MLFPLQIQAYHNLSFSYGACATRLGDPEGSFIKSLSSLHPGSRKSRYAKGVTIYWSSSSAPVRHRGSRRKKTFCSVRWLLPNLLKGGPQFGRFLRRVVDIGTYKEGKTSMAQHSIGNTSSLSNSTSQVHSLYAVLWLRLVCGLTTLLGAVISFFALSWDVQWHTFVGRDRTLTPPHILLLSGIVVCGIGALVAVIVETQ